MVSKKFGIIKNKVMSKKIITLVGLVMLIGVPGLSQSFISDFSFRAGPSFPVGAFSTYDFQKKERGSAEPGFFVEATFRHNFKDKNYGYLAGLSFTSFARAGEELFDTHVPDWGQYMFTVEMGKYNVAGIYGGVFHDFSIQKKVNLQLSASINLNSMSYAYHSFFTSGQPVFKDEERGKPVLVLLYETDATLTYPLSTRINVGLNVGLFVGRARYHTEWTVGNPGNFYSGNETFNQEIAAVNTGLVIAYKLK